MTPRPTHRARRHRGRLALAAMVSLATLGALGCRSAEPQFAPSGDYDLVSVDLQPLPVVTFASATVTRTITGGFMRFSSRGARLIEVTLIQTVGSPDVIDSVVA